MSKILSTSLAVGVARTAAGDGLGPGLRMESAAAPVRAVSPRDMANTKAVAARSHHTRAPAAFVTGKVGTVLIKAVSLWCASERAGWLPYDPTGRDENQSDRGLANKPAQADTGQSPTFDHEGCTAEDA